VVRHQAINYYVIYTISTMTTVRLKHLHRIHSVIAQHIHRSQEKFTNVSTIHNIFLQKTVYIYLSGRRLGRPASVVPGRQYHHAAWNNGSITSFRAMEDM